MLSHLSPKFTIPHTPHTNHEPRAAIILNRFTRTLAILYATHTLSDILGIPSEDAIGRSFYECISEDCLDDAIEALERAKENDSIAYLRFRWRDPRTDGSQPSSNASDSNPDSDSDEEDAPAAGTNPSRAVRDRRPTPTASAAPGEDTIEVEAVVSCTSDGLVVILRRAHGPLQAHGVFASPWSQTPLEPSSAPRNQELMETIRQVAVFAWSLRSINPDIMMHAVPGRPDPDAAEKMGDFVRPGTSHWKRQREWEGEDDDDDEDEDRKGKKKAKVTDRVIRDPRNPGGGRRNGDGALGNEKRVA